MTDFLDAMGVELPCPGCNGTYTISLRQIHLGQQMVGSGCKARHFADCPPVSVAHVLRPSVLADLDVAYHVAEAAAAKAGGRLVWRTGEPTQGAASPIHH